MKKEIKIGIIAIVSILIIYFGIMFLKGIRLGHSQNQYCIRMADVNGLSPQSEVLANGLNVGTVKALSFDPQSQLVNIMIDLNEGFTVPAGTTATLHKDMLGAPKVKLLLGSQGSNLQPGDTINGLPMSDLLSSAGDMIPSVQALIPKLDSILATLNALVASPAISQSLSNIEYSTAALKTTTDQLNTLLADVNKQVPTTLSSLNNVGNNLQQTTAKLNTVDVAGIAQKADAAITNLQQFTDQLSNPNGTLAKLSKDPSLYNELNATAKNASALLEDLKANPKRYVHFSVFGRKDKKTDTPAATTETMPVVIDVPAE